MLAVCPALGWWKTARKLGCYGKRARYALVVTIRTPPVGVDLYGVVVGQVVEKAKAMVEV
jgi:hypothetical protein